MENENDEELTDETGKSSVLLKIGVIFVLVVFPITVLMEIAFFGGACYAIKHYGSEEVFIALANPVKVVDCGMFRIIVEVDDCGAPNIPPEVFVFIEDKKSGDYQEICSVRQHVEIDDCVPVGVSEKKVDCFVWSDALDDCHTEKFEIDVCFDDEEGL